MPQLSNAAIQGLKQLNAPKSSSVVTYKPQKRSVVASSPRSIRRSTKLAGGSRGTSAPRASKTRFNSVSGADTGPPAGYKTSHYRKEVILRNSTDDTITHRGSVEHRVTGLPSARAAAGVAAAAVGGGVAAYRVTQGAIAGAKIAGKLALKGGAKLGSRLIPGVGEVLLGYDALKYGSRAVKAASKSKKVRQAVQASYKLLKGG